MLPFSRWGKDFFAPFFFPANYWWRLILEGHFWVPDIRMVRKKKDYQNDLSLDKERSTKKVRRSRQGARFLRSYHIRAIQEAQSASKSGKGRLPL